MIPRGLRRVAVRTARQRLEGLPADVRELALAMVDSGPGPVVLPGPPPGPVLVVAPHPDDEVIGPGGALARHADAGDPVTVLVVTSGGATAGGGTDVTARREAETRRALAHVAPAAQLRFPGLPDGDLPGREAEIAGLVRAHAAGVRSVYVPSLLDPHPDHRATAVAVADAGLGADVEVMGYEVWAAGPVEVLLDVTDVFARKQAALREYRTALETVDYVRSASGLAAYRSASGGLGGRGFAEGFTRCDGPAWARLVAALRS